jgi:hypothetical protein
MGDAKAETKAWVVTASGEKPLPDVEATVRDAGFTVERVLGEIECITGTASDEVAERLRRLPGVSDVSPAPPPMDVGPPGSSTTW